MDLGGKQIQHDFVKVFLSRTFVGRVKHQNTALHVMFSPGIESLLVLETSRASVSVQSNFFNSFVWEIT